MFINAYLIVYDGAIMDDRNSEITVWTSGFSHKKLPIATAVWI